MMEKSPRFIWGVLAFAIYFVLVGLLLFYFNTRNEDKSKHYVKKDEHRIQVSLSAPQKEKVTKPKPKQTPKKIEKPKPKQQPKTIEKPKPVIKPIVKDSEKKVIKEKVVKKIIEKKDVNLTKPKELKINKPQVEKKIIQKPKTKVEKEIKEKPKKAIDLFSKVETKPLDIKITTKPIETKAKNNIIKVSDAPPSAIERINHAMKNQKSSDSGVENAYFAKVQTILESWPARGEFLGEHATVTLFIKPTGKFEFQVTSGSNNESFSRSVMDFLKQLQRLGFGKHDAGRTYEFEVEFSTKE